jgi:hypothetical protein
MTAWNFANPIGDPAHHAVFSDLLGLNHKTLLEVAACPTNPLGGLRTGNPRLPRGALCVPIGSPNIRSLLNTNNA